VSVDISLIGEFVTVTVSFVLLATLRTMPSSSVKCTFTLNVCVNTAERSWLISPERRIFSVFSCDFFLRILLFTVSSVLISRPCVK
jgi:hypothetical protein